jgi:glycine cleavage system H lipoate-binding protein
MFGHDFLAGYSAKLLEYGLAVSYLALFVAFWRYVQGGKKAPQPAAEFAPERAAPTGWFEIPADVALHPGHTWARPLADGTVAVGLDDLGHRLVGAVEHVELPRAGAQVLQGELVVRLGAGGKSVGLLSPVDGEVLAYNAEIAAHPGESAEPYGQAWLFKVRPTHWKRNQAQLLAGPAARDWIEEQARQLYAKLTPEPAALLQDGGVPINGIAREVDPEHWDDIARLFFRTEGA